ncbi:hypothetical protein P168DRAFT_293852 [Aspergillus campestris IBT 28561]|uniref:Peroxisomal biogenesis factor 11 n=1 Tax=Aspergillus campestris (strain IBT 28561) TaxID=1392248 RepID=A0A2I1CQS0_ASPC2|nr:uncharacterized protein P168DRAFT_293852 [Aspergillus campestris IBT 28561]PKX99970.1 hypothetical protein P168DRAFT_293852 [Aspergillus campestris IBT 28561]
MASAYGQERVFAVTGYLSHALYHLLDSAPWIALQAPRRRGPASRLLALSALMTETRYTLRLLGLVPLWTWGSGELKSPHPDRAIHILTLLQVVSNVLYQALENAGFLAAKGIISKKFLDRWGGIDKWYLWSTRAWFGHIFLQFFVLWRLRVLRAARRAAAAAAGAAGGEKKADDAESEAAETRAWTKSLVNNVCWTPLCLHWCAEEGLGFPASLTGVVSFMAGAWGVFDMWKATA